MAFATIVPEAKRLQFLPKHFHLDYLRIEQMVYDLAREQLDGYNGGYWDYAESVSCQAPIMIPPPGPLPGGKWELTNPIGESVKVSPEAAGIILTTVAVNALWHTYPENELLERAWMRLQDYGHHPESAAIWRALD